jgi:hypothetical protein
MILPVMDNLIQPWINSILKSAFNEDLIKLLNEILNIIKSVAQQVDWSCLRMWSLWISIPIISIWFCYRCYQRICTMDKFSRISRWGHKFLPNAQCGALRIGREHQTKHFSCRQCGNQEQRQIAEIRWVKSLMYEFYSFGFILV